MLPPARVNGASTGKWNLGRLGEIETGESQAQVGQMTIHGVLVMMIDITKRVLILGPERIPTIETATTTEPHRVPRIDLTATDVGVEVGAAAQNGDIAISDDETTERCIVILLPVLRDLFPQIRDWILVASPHSVPNKLISDLYEVRETISGKTGPNHDRHAGRSLLQPHHPPDRIRYCVSLPNKVANFDASMVVKVAIIGSGLAGLTAAHILATAKRSHDENLDGIAPFEVHLFEAVSKVFQNSFPMMFIAFSFRGTSWGWIRRLSR
jgi:hypothetical protein